jgi:biopolymer transport protein ExbD
MRPRRRRPRSIGLDGIHDPNLTPLIDVSLVLVVILLVAVPMALQSGIAVSHAATSGRAGPASPEARVEIEVLDPDHVVVNRAAIPRASLGAVLKPLLAESPTRDVVVRCADAVPHGAFVSVIDEARTQGATRIAVAGK